MKSLKQAWFLLWRNSVLWWIIIFGILSLVPLFITTVLIIFSVSAADVGAANESVVFAFLAGLFFLMLIFYQAFVQSLLVGAANVLVKKKKLSFLLMFKNMRPLYWRVVGYGFSALILMVPSFVLGFIGATSFTEGSQAAILFFGLSFVWIFLVLLALLWTPTFLPRFGVIKSIKSAWKEFTLKPTYTLVTLLVILGCTAFVTFVIFGIQYFFGKTITVNVIARFINFVLAVYVMLYLFSRKTLKKK